MVCRVFRKKNYQKTLESPKSTSNSMDSRAQMMNSSNDGVLDQILSYMGRTCKQENEAISNVNFSDSNTMRFLNQGISSTEGLQERFMHLPRLESPTTLPALPNNTNSSHFDQERCFNISCLQSIDDMLRGSDHPEPQPEPEPDTELESQLDSGCNTTITAPTKPGLNDWVTFDRLVASQLNGQVDTKQLSCFSTDPNMAFCLSPDHDIEQLSHLRSSTRSAYNTEMDLWNFTRSSSSSSSDPLGHLSV